MTHSRAGGLRRILLALLSLGIVVTSVDLLLLQHYEDIWQFVPLVLNGVGIAAIACFLLTGAPYSLRLMQAVMGLLVLAGMAGVVLHFQGNMEFQLDIDPSLSTWDLCWKVLRSKAPPALAPAAIAQLGLLGLVFCYRHPALSSVRADQGRVHEEGMEE
ncbi:MAG TPA: hypothetical protein VLV83_09315 [Acidobacteriota bacterium]|nr:hypothetical protein [Acidobacteriota bacterium]